MHNYFFGLDFDGNIAKTFEPSPNGVGVTEAYRLTVRDIFGEEGLRTYDRVGGLKNKAPGQLVRLLLEEDTTGELFSSAKTFFEEYSHHFSPYLESPSVVALVWDEIDVARTITELLVRRKIEYLVDEVGTCFDDGRQWPEACLGFPALWQTIHELNTESQGLFRIYTGIISSGHRVIIQKVFEKVWNLPMPDIVVSDDEIRWRRHPHSSTGRREKPGQLPMGLAHLAWLRMIEQLQPGMNYAELGRVSRDKMAFFGDDEKKDGLLAEGAGIPFGLFEQQKANLLKSDVHLVINDWQVIANLLRRSKEQFSNGRTMREILGFRMSTIEGGYTPNQREGYAPRRGKE